MPIGPGFFFFLACLYHGLRPLLPRQIRSACQKDLIAIVLFRLMPTYARYYIYLSSRMHWSYTRARKTMTRYDFRLGMPEHYINTRL